MKLSMKIASALIGFSALTVSATAMADMKIGVVNYMQVFQQTPQGNATLNQLKAQLQPQLDKLKDQQAQLAQQAQALEKNAPTMTKADRATQEKALAQKEQDFQNQVNSLRDAEMKKEQDAANNFENALQDAVNQVAKKGNYDMVLTSQATPYVSQKYDITTSVVQVMQQEASSN
jgi:outer membrane protein